MRKIITCILSIIVLTVGGAGTVRGQELTANSSAALKISADQEQFDYRVTKLETFLSKYNSPLVTYSRDFVEHADTYGLDYRLVPAITGVESTFGKRIPHNSYNAYGWANGEYRFTSWEDSIEHVSMTLRTKYIEKGAVSIPQIARRYAPPSSTWGGKVKFFMTKLDSLPLTFDI